jgi:2-keto-4-pentenoate hydratase/2-oxohepta-3-ene-1,7-dioic acid hydratase in catechol pathway
MRLIRFGPAGSERPGVLVGGVRKNCSAHFADWDREFFRDSGLAKLAALLANEAPLPDVPSDARWGPPVARPGKIVCIGLNYRDHAAETGATLPTEPLIFMKATTALAGPYDQVLIPRTSEKTDYEIELAVVIGRDARYLVSVEEASGHIAGYCLANDVSERHFQKERGGQMTKGKSCDTFFPLGPWLSTSDEIADPLKLPMRLTVNGQPRQSATTGDMVFGPAMLVHYLSQFMTLEAGDVISTGTPAGVGLGRKPPEFLLAGDVVELSIEGLGNQRQVMGEA